MAYGNTAKDGSGSFYHLLVDTLGRLRLNDEWHPAIQSDVTLNDSNKTFTVPANTEWRVKWIWIEFTTTATATNRQIEIQIQDGAADVVGELVPSLTQAPSLTYNYLFSPSGPAAETLRDTDQTHILMPEWYLPESFVVRLWDNNAVDAAADDMICKMMVLVRNI